MPKESETKIMLASFELLDEIRGDFGEYLFVEIKRDDKAESHKWKFTYQCSAKVEVSFIVFWHNSAADLLKHLKEVQETLRKVHDVL